MASRKTERLQKQVEERIGQYKAVVEYLSKKTDVAAIPLTNRVCITNVLLQGGWKPDGELFLKGDKSLNLIEAGKIEFKEQYDHMCAEHIAKILKEG
jgi:hypothetical protein